ncbi:hypothetical protein B296_00054102 [Ensete ventricosum]|uniref:Uncharacterized protein n=1 Tax=Ensete ventricosum TaxID=4639 RepID=A0A426Y574_ENSVE|nr:hypothetical protein B296_00054102 [Ensete ventricosum]
MLDDFKPQTPHVSTEAVVFSDQGDPVGNQEDDRGGGGSGVVGGSFKSTTRRTPNPSTRNVICLAGEREVPSAVLIPTGTGAAVGPVGLHPQPLAGAAPPSTGCEHANPNGDEGRAGRLMAGERRALPPVTATRAGARFPAFFLQPWPQKGWRSLSDETMCSCKAK